MLKERCQETQTGRFRLFQGLMAKDACCWQKCEKPLSRLIGTKSCLKAFADVVVLRHLLRTRLFTHAAGTSRLMDTLEAIFSMQKELASMMDLSRYPTSGEGRVSALSTAIIHEAVELQRLTSWKWWKKPAPFDSKAAREELIDIWHFVVQASI